MPTDQSRIAGSLTQIISIDQDLRASTDASGTGLDQWTRGAIRTGSALIVVAGIVNLLQMRSGLLPYNPVSISCVLFNFVVSLAAAAATYASWFNRRWRELAWVMAASAVLGLTAVGISADRMELLYIPLLLMVVGSSMLLPWSPAWQASFSAFCLAAWGAGILVARHRDLDAPFRWVGIGAGALLAQLAVIFRTWQLEAQAESNRRIRESETKLRKLFEASPDTITLNRIADGCYLDVNHAFHETTGYSREETVGRTDLELGLWTDHKVRDRFYDLLRRRGGVQSLEAQFRLRDGTTVPCLVSAVPIDLDDEPCFISVTHGILRLKRAEQELVAAREEALAASRAKSEFLSSMSHEIRTPLHAILGMADLLLETPLNDDQQRYLATMADNGNTLLELINGILDLARVESGHLVLENVSFDPEALVGRVFDTLGVRAHEKGLELAARIAPGVPLALIGDPLRLRQILLNLIGNATKFTERGDVTLTVERCEPPAKLAQEEVMIRFAVTDTGIGISKLHLDRIFANFSQADSSTTRKYGGTGLGLAIAKRLVELMGGEIRVESELGRGSTFSFTSRFRLDAAAAGTDVTVASPDLAGMRALVGDASAINRSLLNQMLTARGARVTEASSCASVVGAIEQAAAEGEPYTLLMIASRMPETDGFQLARKARSIAGPDARVVLMLTSDDLTSQLQRLHQSGITYHLVKPIRRVELMNAIAHAMAPPAAVNATNGSRNGAVDISRPLRILLADDSADNRALIVAFLKDTPCQVDTVEDGARVVERFKRETYDLVLMDLQMPVMDGDEATREIRRFERETRRSHTPIVALSASVLSESVAKSLAAGCDAHVGKPVKKAALVQMIHRLADTPSTSGPKPTALA
ncbi:MAG: response regulator [Candidatus Binataceae bacterium]